MHIHIFLIASVKNTMFGLFLTYMTNSYFGMFGDFGMSINVHTCTVYSVQPELQTNLIRVLIVPLIIMEGLSQYGHIFMRL